MALKKSQLYSKLWQSCDELRAAPPGSAALPSLVYRHLFALIRSQMYKYQ